MHTMGLTTLSKRKTSSFGGFLVCVPTDPFSLAHFCAMRSNSILSSCEANWSTLNKEISAFNLADKKSCNAAKHWARQNHWSQTHWADKKSKRWKTKRLKRQKVEKTKQYVEKMKSWNKKKIEKKKVEKKKVKKLKRWKVKKKKRQRP